MRHLLVIVLFLAGSQIGYAQTQTPDADVPADDAAKIDGPSSQQDSSQVLEKEITESETGETPATDEAEPSTDSDPTTESVVQEGESGNESVKSSGTESEAEDVSQDQPDADPASKPVATVDELSVSSTLRTRVTGSLRSEMYFSQKPQMTSAGAGTYHLESLNVFPFYEIIQLRADEVGHRGLSVHVQGIAGLDLAEVYFDQRFVADPTYAYLQFRDYGADIRLGRQMVFTGTTQGLHLDGLYGSYQTPIYLGIEALGGLVVSPKQGPDWYRDSVSNVNYSEYGRGFTDWSREGDYAVGGRLFYRVVGKASAGVSFLHVTHLKETDKQLLGVDADLTPVKWLGINGNASVDLYASSLREAKAAVDFFIGDKTSATVSYQHTDPTLYLSHMSIFSVFSTQMYDSVGASVHLRPIPRLSIGFGYDQLFYSYMEEDDGQTDTALDLGYEIRLDTSLAFGKKKNGVGRFGYRRLAQDSAGVDQFRLGASVPLIVPELKGSANAYLDLYQKAVNGQKVGFIGDLGVFYSNGPIETGGSLAAGATPYAKAEVRGMVKFTYNFSASFFE